ncbi:MAG: Asp/Glu/hydantoin racemase [Rhizobiales bacterium PAR1]|nr:MAG: Asp/Glu/hydantoin racemase [Rhizobiales bacterium PAR1]
MTKPFALATITPSGNRVVERVVQAMLRDLPDASAHFTRIPVVGDTGGVAGYDMARMLDAATLLSHAQPDVVSWNGTKGGALGFDVDRALCGEMTAATGLPSSTSALAILDALALLKARTIALVTPYDAAYQAKCIAAFAAKGYPTVAERGSGLLDNFAYGLVPGGDIATMTRAAIGERRPDAVVYFCTNFGGAEVAAEIEAACDVPVLDSTALGVWGALRAAGRSTIPLAHWGRIFAL